jgi:hypothetical protein
MMGMEMVPEMLVSSYNQLMLLIAREDFMEFSHTAKTSNHTDTDSIVKQTTNEIGNIQDQTQNPLFVDHSILVFKCQGFLFTEFLDTFEIKTFTHMKIFPLGMFLCGRKSGVICVKISIHVVLVTVMME